MMAHFCCPSPEEAGAGELKMPGCVTRPCPTKERQTEKEKRRREGGQRGGVKTERMDLELSTFEFSS